MSKRETPLEASSDYTRTSIKGFCDKHGLVPELLQVPRRVHDCWDVLADVAEALADLDDLQQSVRFGKLPYTNSGGPGDIIRSHLWLCGSYPVNPEITDERWANPTYTHGDQHQEPVDGWQTHVEQAATHPTVRLTHVAQRFGIERRTLSDRILRQGWNFEDRARANRRRIIKTMLTTAAWSDRSFNSMCETLPITRRAVYNWKGLVAADWEPPAMPDSSRWR